ncbi:3348_t:CDS:2, partial [Racocetra persica]
MNFESSTSGTTDSQQIILIDTNSDSLASNMSNNQQIPRGYPKDVVWEYFTKGSAADKYGHYGATCQYCGQYWLREKPKIMESYLVLYCEKVSNNVNTIFLCKVAERAERSQDDTFTCCDILWAVIVNPFFVDLLKISEPGYTPPSRNTLSGHLLDKELATIS